MAKKLLSRVMALWLLAAACFGQSSFHGIVPGSSTRADVERVLGVPVKNVSATVTEYNPMPLTSKIFVQYRKGAPIVEQIAVNCRLANSTCDDLTRDLNLHLEKESQAATISENGQDKYIFLYGAPLYVVATGDAESIVGNKITPARIAFYTRELFEVTAARTRKGGKALPRLAPVEQISIDRSPLVINVRHHHGGGGECRGILQISPGVISFRSNQPDHGFDLPLAQVAGFSAKLRSGLEIRLTANGRSYQFSDNSSDDPAACAELRQMQLTCQ